VVHAIAFSDKSELARRYVDTSRGNFQTSMDISCLLLHRRAAARREDDEERRRAVTLTYYGAERVMPHYNVMGVAKAALEASVRYMAEDLGKDGIRVNAISRRGRSRRWPPRHRRFPLHHEVERVQLAAAPQCQPSTMSAIRRCTCCRICLPA
jgi:NAD(P)-dependent dehydrogenase (short-subunit alcohol dehydrogenase family)